MNTTLRVLMFVATDVTNDPRVMKEAQALNAAGYAVQVIGVCRSGQEQRFENIQNICIYRIDLWSRRFVRWLKQRRGRTVTQSVFSVSTDKASLQGFNWRLRLVSLAHQLQFVLDLFVLFFAFFFIAFRQRADIYHAHDVDMLLAALFLGWLRQRPVIYDSHEYWYNERRHERISNTLIRTIERFGASRCHQVFTVNRSIAERMVAYYDIPMPTVLMNVPADEPAQLPNPLPVDQPVQLLYHGSYMRGRGLEQLISAMTLVQTPVHLTLRGFGDIEQPLRAQVEALSLQHKVTFSPPVAMRELSVKATTSQVGIIPYSKAVAEFALPNKLFEYMAAGLALLTNDLVEFRAIVEGHQLGLVCDASQPIAIARAIDLLASDRSRLEEYRQRAWQAYRQYYTWKAHQKVLLDVYARLLGQQGQ